MSRSALLWAVCLSTAGAAQEARLWTTELALGTNVAQFEGARRELWEGRLVALRVVIHGLTADARAQFTSVSGAGSPPVRGSLELRLGYSGRRWAAVAGAYLLDGFTTSPRLAALPTARVQLSVGGLSLVAGLWDFHLPDVPFHLSVESRDFGLGYLFPYGVEAHARIRLVEFIGLTVQGLVLQRPGGDLVAFGSLMATVGVLAGKPAGPRQLIPPILDPSR